MKLAVLKETYPGERRVALLPANIPALAKLGIEVLLESGAGVAAGFADQHYSDRGATVVSDRGQLQQAQAVVQIRILGSNPDHWRQDLQGLPTGTAVIGMCDPLGEAATVRQAAEMGLSIFSLEMMPRITRAQSMDVLSSMATIAGYRAVLLAAVELPKMFPMLMTAAGTVSAAKVFVIGAGVAGLQAIATARRLGAIVQAYDVRPPTREQVESLGAKFVEMPLDAGQSEDQGGYAREMNEDFYRRQREFMADVVAESNVVISTAAIPGKRSPLLITAAAVQRMPPGGVIIDLAAERGGNCELSQADRRVEEHDVVILGPTNLPSEIPRDASQMYGNNLTRFLQNMVKDGKLQLNLEDEIIRDTLVAHEGHVVNARLREMLQLPAIAPAAKQDDDAVATETD